MKRLPGGCGRDLLQTVLRTIRRHDLFAPGDAVLAGVSGGPDSVALLHLLLRLADRFSLTLGIAHLNHGLRGDASDRDARFVAELASSLDLPLHADRWDVPRLRREWRLRSEERRGGKEVRCRGVPDP